MDTLGNPDDYIDLLELRLDKIGLISSFGIADKEGRELVIVLSENKDHTWYVASRESGNSLSRMRDDNGIQYISLQGDDVSQNIA